MINSLKDKLSSSKGLFLSIGGRVTLLNNVLYNMPSYQLSCYKVPLKVVKEISAIRRKFLWHGVVEKKGLDWVKWDIMCNSRIEGGLGSKDIGNFN